MSLIVIAALAGCGPNSDLEPGDIVTPTTAPTVAASAVFARPVGNPTFAWDHHRRMSYQHSGSSLYSMAGTELVNASQVTVRSREDRPYLDQHRFYRAPIINQRRWDIPSDGNWVIRATYKTQNSSYFPEPYGIRSVVSSSPFQICQAGTSGCTGPAGPGGTDNKTVYCGPYGDQCEPPGGGSGTPSQWFQNLRRHAASMGPFFAASNIGSSTSASEVEAMVNSLTTPQRDGIADIVYEAYGRSIYEYFRVPTSHWNQDESMADGTGSDFLDLTAPLAYADTGLMSSTQYDHFNQLMAVMSAHEADLNESAKQGGGMESEQTGRHGVAWPNPAIDVVRLRVPEDAVGVVRVFDMVGRLVATVPFVESTAEQTVEWNLRADGGGRVAPGLYRLVVPTHGGARVGSSVVVL